MWVCWWALHHLHWSALQAEARWRWSYYPLLIILTHPHISFPALQTCSLTAALCFNSSQCKHMISSLCCKPTLLFGSPMRSCLTRAKQRQSTQKVFAYSPYKKYLLFFDSFPARSDAICSGSMRRRTTVPLVLNLHQVIFVVIFSPFKLLFSDLLSNSTRCPTMLPVCHQLCLSAVWSTVAFLFSSNGWDTNVCRHCKHNANWIIWIYYSTFSSWILQSLASIHMTV